MTATNDIGGEKIHLVTVRVADQIFALNVLDVERVIPHRPATLLPDSRDYFEGMIPYGDEMIPVLDLRKRFEMAAPITDALRVVVVTGGFGRVGLVVDAAISLQAVPVNAIMAPPQSVRGLTADYVAGIVDETDAPIVVLTVSKLISSTERIALRSVEAGVADE